MSTGPLRSSFSAPIAPSSRPRKLPKRLPVIVGVLWVVALSSFALVSPSNAADVGTGDVVVLVEPNGRWHIPQSGTADYTFFYGNPGDVPLLGDWDGDGLDSPGMFRPSTGFVYLSNDLPPNGGVGFGAPDLTFFFGMSGDQVVVGDWDGDGTDTLGIRRNGKMFLSNVNATAVAQREFFFGVPGDLAFGGDPDGEGTDSVFLYRASSGFVYYTNQTPLGPNTVAMTAAEFFYGVPSDRFVIGDWDGDGADNVGIFRPVEAMVYLRNENSLGPADATYPFGQSDWLPVAGATTVMEPSGTTTSTSSTSTSSTSTSSTTPTSTTTSTTTTTTTPPVSTYVLQVNTAGSGRGAVRVSPGGFECADDCSYEFEAGEMVTLGAIPVHSPPYTSHRFDGWSGACRGAGSCTLTMNQDQSVVAIFVPNHSVSLTVQNAPDEQGVVWVDPAGEAFDVSCPPGSCTYRFFAGTTVTLTAVPEAGYTFAEWSGGPCGTSNPCVITLDADVTVSPQFAAVPMFELSTYAYVDGFFGRVVSDPPGIDCVNSRDADCVELYPAGTQVTLTATPGEGTAFVEWIGGDCGTANPCVITLNADMVVYPTWREA